MSDKEKVSWLAVLQVPPLFFILGSFMATAGHVRGAAEGLWLGGSIYAFVFIVWIFRVTYLAGQRSRR